MSGKRSKNEGRAGACTRAVAQSDFYLQQQSDGSCIGRFKAFDGIESVEHFVTTRQGFDTNAALNDRQTATEQISTFAGLNGVAWCNQVHGRVVRAVENAGCAGDGDGLVTNISSLGLAGFSADCPLIIATDLISGAVGVAHASWRGIVGRIASELVLQFAVKFESHPRDLIVGICPSAGPCCYEVKQDVFAAVVGGAGRRSEKFFVYRDGKMFLNMWAANRDELVRTGVRPENIHVAGVCTICRNDVFPSYRREGNAAGRFMAVISRK